tara:strand:+ start:632 stop:1057 length:426 start_codon:yes stop_codon:yes gene_type:complete
MDLANIDVIAWWGAGLSTVLALIKIGELWRDRFRIDIGHKFTSEPDIGNEIYIRNLSGKPIILGFWELFYRPHLWPIKKDSYIDSPEDEAYDLKIDPHSSETISFSGANYFYSGWKAMKGRRIYIRLHIAGRRPVLKRVNR